MSDQFTLWVYPLRYYPSLVTGEFLNVGVAVVSPESRQWAARVAQSLRGFRRVFPTAQPKALTAELARIADALSRDKSSRVALELPRTWSDPLDPVRVAIGPLWGSLRWAENAITTSSDNLQLELDYWFEQLVHIGGSNGESRDAAHPVNRLDHAFENALERRGILRRLKPAEVGSYIRERFEHTYQNGHLNVFEAINLSYVKPGRIRSQGQLWRGKLDILNEDARDPFNFFALVDLPSDPALRAEAQTAMKMIEHAQANQIEIFTADQLEAFVDLAEKVVLHESY